MDIPIDFEKLIKLPDGNGYPYSIKAAHLMENFAWCDLLPSQSGDELRIELEEVSGETARHRQRRMKVVAQAVAVIVIDNGEFKTGNFLVTGPLTSV